MSRPSDLQFMIAFSVLLTFSADTAELPEIEGPNLIVNGNFDEPGEGVKCPFASWVGRSGQNGKYTFDLAEGRSGKAASITGTVAGRGDIHTKEMFAAKAGEKLRVRFWAKTANMSGGAFVTLEGEPNDDGWHKINIDTGAKDWKLYEARVDVPKGQKGQLEPKISMWFYHFGTGALLIDDVSVCVVKADPKAAAKQELEFLLSQAKAKSLGAIAGKLSDALKDPKPEQLIDLRRELYAAAGKASGGDGSFALGATHSLDRVFLDEPFRGGLPDKINLALAQNESEAFQIVILPSGKALKNVLVSLDGDFGGVQARIEIEGFVDTSQGTRPYQSPKLGWWPDPLLPNAAFSVRADESQPLLVTFTTDEKTAPGTKGGAIVVRCENATIKLPVELEVFNFALPKTGHFSSWSGGCSAGVIAKYYGSDSGEKIMERFAIEASKRRMPTIDLLNGWAWKTPRIPKTADGYDFAKLDRWLDLLKDHGLTRFPMVNAPRFRKFGGGDYDNQFMAEFISFVKAYSTHLKSRGLFDRAVMYNIDEASNEPALREWDECKKIYKAVKQAVPDLRVVQCLNEFKGVQALSGNADVWDLYYGQYEQAGGPARLKAGDEIMLAVCIWPAEHPNLFIEYPLLDARVMPWIGFKVGAKGFEYWDMFQWEGNSGKIDWINGGDGTRTAWKLGKPHGDGLLIYPGPDGTPLSSLRLESLRDGLEDYEYLHLLSEKSKSDPGAAALLKQATEQIVTGVTSYDSNPQRLLELRLQIGRLLSGK